MDNLYQEFFINLIIYLVVMFFIFNTNILDWDKNKKIAAWLFFIAHCFIGWLIIPPYTSIGNIIFFSFIAGIMIMLCGIAGASISSVLKLEKYLGLKTSRMIGFAVSFAIAYLFLYRRAIESFLFN